MAIEVQCEDCTLLFVNIYMPFCCESNLPDFMYYLGKINSVVNDCKNPYVFILGDFNANVSSDTVGNRHKFGVELQDFCQNEDPFISDVLLCPVNSYTFYSDAHDSVSWLDHIVTTPYIQLKMNCSRLCMEGTLMAVCR